MTGRDIFDMADALPVRTGREAPAQATIWAAVETVTPAEAWAFLTEKKRAAVREAVEAEIRRGAWQSVDRAGIARALALRTLTADQRLAIVRARGTVPEDCGDAIPDAPARGAFRVFTPQDMVVEGDRTVWKDAGYRGRRAIREADVFDIMGQKARARGRADHPLTPGQIEMGRTYRRLVEDYEGRGARGCLTALHQTGGGGTGGGYVEALIQQSRLIEVLRRRIGPGIAKAVRRQRPSATGSRRQITDRTLVDLVCLGDMAVSGVAERHGWKNDATLISILTRALADALERMRGPDHGTAPGPLRMFTRTDLSRGGDGVRDVGGAE